MSDANRSTQPVQLDSSDLNALLYLYRETWGEIDRLRDYEWRIAYYFISLAAGQMAFLLSDTILELLTLGLRILLTLVQVAAIIFSFVYIEITHTYLTRQRNIRRNLEEIFRFYESTEAREAVLPREWKGKRIERRFQRLGLVVPIEITVLIVQILAIVLTWVVGQ